MKKLIYLSILAILPTTMQAQNIYNLLIGTYTNGKSEGIYVYEFDCKTGDFKLKSKTATDNPSFLAVSHDRKHVYAVNETPDAGAVSAFGYNLKSGELQFLNKVASEGADPCFITTDQTDKNVFVANYSGGNLSVFDIKSDGSLSKAVQVIQHEGHGINKTRQEKAHVHSTVLSPDDKYLLVNDLGLDKIIIYRYNKANQKPLTPSTPPFVKLEAGSGPRHIAFHPNNKWVYSIQELSATVDAFTYHDGKFNQFQSLSLIPEGFKGEVGAAEILVSEDGKFLYASNRGDANDICIFRIEDKTGKLSFAGRQSSLGRGPRSFAIAPGGNFLLAANQYTDNVIIFKRDPKTGLLTDTGKRIETGNPVCLVFSKTN